MWKSKVLVISRESRPMPMRDCKNRPRVLQPQLQLQQENNGDKKTDRITKIKKRKLKRGLQQQRNTGLQKRNNSRTRVTRGAITQFQLDSAKAKRRHQKRNRLHVARTVELVNQQNDDWRNEKSKLIFMLGIGLTPKPNEDTKTVAGVINPVIRVSRADPKIVSKILARYESIKAAAKAARHKARLNRFEALRKLNLQKQINNNNNVKKEDPPVEVIDLLSDDEEETEPTEASPEYIIPENTLPEDEDNEEQLLSDLSFRFLPRYPHLTILKI